MNFRKLLCCAAAALTAAMGMPLPASAQQTYTYTLLDDGTAEITCADTSLASAEIPSQIDGYTVTAIAEKGFAGCASLKSVTLPETLIEIGDNAFSGCAVLESITIPAQVASIGAFVFEGCTALTAIDVDDASISYMDDEGVLYSADQTTLVRYPAARAGAAYTIATACRTISPWAFTYCNQLQYLEMAGVTAIGADAFMYAESLQTVILSEGIKELIGASFAYCINLRKLTLPSTLEVIGNKCFYGCVSLPSVQLPDGLTSIGEMAFYGCMQLKEMEVPASVKIIGNMGIGYSVDPDTNQNVVLPDFKLQTYTGSKGNSYAVKNGIAHTSTMSRDYAMKWILIALAVIIVVLGVVAVLYRRHANAQAYAKKMEAQRRAKKAEKKQQRKS